MGGARDGSEVNGYPQLMFQPCLKLRVLNVVWQPFICFIYSMLRPSGVFSDGWRCDFYSCISQLFRVFVSCTRNLGPQLIILRENKREKVVQERGRIAPQRPSVRAAIVCYCFAAKFTK